MRRIGRGRLYAALILIVIFECALSSLTDIGGVRPNITLMLVLFVGLYSDWPEALEAGIVGGLLRGAVSIGPPAAGVAIFTASALFASCLKNKIYKDSMPAQAILVFLIGIIFNLTAMASRFLSVPPAPVEMGMLPRPPFFTVIYASFYTAFLAPFFFFFFRGFFRVGRPVD